MITRSRPGKALSDRFRKRGGKKLLFRGNSLAAGSSGSITADKIVGDDWNTGQNLGPTWTLM